MGTTRRARRDFAVLRARRMQAAKLFEQGHRQAEVARRLRVSRPSVHRWYQGWRRQGRAGLRGAGRAGRQPRLSSKDLRWLEGALLQGPAAWGVRTHLWTLRRIVEVIWKTCGVRYSVPQVWRILRQLGWSRQRPHRRARERHEAALAGWVRGRWPQLKKTLGR